MTDLTSCDFTSNGCTDESCVKCYGTPESRSEARQRGDDERRRRQVWAKELDSKR